MMRHPAVAPSLEERANAFDNSAPIYYVHIAVVRKQCQETGGLAKKCDVGCLNNESHLRLRAVTLYHVIDCGHRSLYYAVPR